MGPQHSTRFSMRRGLRISAVTAFSLLTIGGIIGYALGLPPTQAAELPGPVTTAETETETGWLETARFSWTPQDRNGTARQAWGLFAAAELGDTLYLLVFTNAQTPESRALWRSDDGASWDEIPLEFGAGTVIHDAAVFDDGLLLAGWRGEVPTVWAGRGQVDLSHEWTEIPLAYGGLPGSAGGISKQCLLGAHRRAAY